MPSGDAALCGARVADDRSDWAGARVALRELDSEQPLGADDLERLAWSCRWVGRPGGVPERARAGRGGLRRRRCAHRCRPHGPRAGPPAQADARRLRGAHLLPAGHGAPRGRARVGRARAGAVVALVHADGGGRQRGGAGGSSTKRVRSPDGWAAPGWRRWRCRGWRTSPSPKAAWARSSRSSTRRRRSPCGPESRRSTPATCTAR